MSCCVGLATTFWTLSLLATRSANWNSGMVARSSQMMASIWLTLSTWAAGSSSALALAKSA